MRMSYPTNVKIIRVPCTGKVDALYLLKALEDGVDGVYVAGCEEGDCHFLKGNLRAKRRVGYVKSILRELGINPGRVEMFNMSAADGPRFVDVARTFSDRIKALGPSPIRTGKGRESIEEPGTKKQESKGEGPKSEGKPAGGEAAQPAA
jgi:F420-non-reducing hydrogenase iron-sulfur subunit